MYVYENIKWFIFVLIGVYKMNINVINIRKFICVGNDWKKKESIGFLSFFKEFIEEGLFLIFFKCFLLIIFIF